MFSGKVIFSKRLQQILSGGVLFKMEKDQCPEVIFESHLEFAISFGLKFGHIFHAQGLIVRGMYNLL